MEKQNKSYNTVEKISFGIGILVLLVLISFLVYQISQKKNVPPILELTLDEEPLTPSYDFKVVVENVGEETAEEATIVLRLYQEGTAVEEGTISLHYVPFKSKKTAWIVFHQQKKPGDSVVVASMTFVKP